MKKLLIAFLLIPTITFAQDKRTSLSARTQFVCDSLASNGMWQLDNSYIQDVPYYMKAGKKYEWLWAVRNNEVELIKYCFWKDNKGHGVRLVKRSTIK